MKKKSRFKISIRTKTFALMIVAGFLISCLSLYVSFALFKESSIASNIDLASTVTEIAKSSLDADKIDQYLKNGRAENDYPDTEKKLRSILSSNANIKYLYVYKIEDDGCHVVFDLENATLDETIPGEILPFDEGFEQYLPKLLAGESIEPIISKDSYGWLLTVYSPLYDKAGNCKCYVAVDISMDIIYNYISKFFTKFAIIVIVVFILTTSIALIIINHDLIHPINKIANTTDAFSYKSAQVAQDNLLLIKELRIRRSDEIGNLYRAIVKTTQKSVRYLVDSERKNKTIVMMQSGLIMCLADMVECRDKDTGNHIRKTVAYCSIIASQMQKLGYYKEQLTDEFVENLLYAAPLHDIGKIHIPDSILLKNGKLTDEEFAIMQNHTTFGAEMIEKVSEFVPESKYLEEAKKVAKYHHEKWNGTGYPEGISGEAIPLSARIMAVADVFDALTSKRSYKKAFSFDKAIEIIKEGKNTHFDPLVVDAFLAASDIIQNYLELS